MILRYQEVERTVVWGKGKKQSEVHRGQDGFKVRLIETSKVRMGSLAKRIKVISSNCLILCSCHPTVGIRLPKYKDESKQYELNAHRLLVGRNVELELIPHRRI
jgi:hypothetical protein